METDLLIQKLKHQIERAQDLEKEYEGKHKGSAYLRRSIIIKEKFEYLVNKINQLGMGKLILWKAMLKDHNDIIKSVKISLLDTFTEEDVRNILKLRTKSPHILDLKKVDEIIIGQVYPE